jgi:hypothetical protein
MTVRLRRVSGWGRWFNTTIFRARDRASLAVNPFFPDTLPGASSGPAMITGADEAIAAHQRIAENQWRDALKGTTAASRVRAILGGSRAT